MFKDMVNATGFTREFVIKLPGLWRVVVHDSDSAGLMINEDGCIALVRLRGYEESVIKAEAEVLDRIAKAHGGSEASQNLVNKWRVVFSRDYENQLM